MAFAIVARPAQVHFDILMFTLSRRAQSKHLLSLKFRCTSSVPSNKLVYFRKAQCVPRGNQRARHQTCGTDDWRLRHDRFPYVWCDRAIHVSPRFWRSAPSHTREHIGTGTRARPCVKWRDSLQYHDSDIRVGCTHDTHMTHTQAANDYEALFSSTMSQLP